MLANITKHIRAELRIPYDYVRFQFSALLFGLILSHTFPATPDSLVGSLAYKMSKINPDVQLESWVHPQPNCGWQGEMN